MRSITDMKHTPTPAQTVGPFYGYALPYPDGPHLIHPSRPGAVRPSRVRR